MQTDTLQSLRQKYDTDGYCVAHNVIDPGLVQEVRDHVDWLAKKHPEARPEQYHNWMMTHDAFWVRLIADNRLLDIAEQFIGPNIALFASHYIAKPPKDGQPVLWHQDGAYWPLDPMEVVTLWLAADDSTPENGCLRVIPGTQHLEFFEILERKDVDNVLSSGIDENVVDADKAVDIILKAGDVSIHHPNVIHGSEANHSDKWRRGLTIRYIPTSTRIVTPDNRIWESAFLLRGDPVPGINTYVPWPKYDPENSMNFKGSENWPPAGRG
jgi:ectoine hydroxylase-related dioxygenase (phytanoyl-CoA dioxygenase family)